MKVQFAALLASRGGGSLLLAICNVLVARWSGPTSFGQLSTVLSAGAVFFVVVDFGFSTFISRAEARHESGDVSAALWLNTVTSAIGGVVAVLVVVAASLTLGYRMEMVFLGISMALEKNMDTALGVPIARGDKLTPAMSVLIRRSLALSLLLGTHLVGLNPIAAYSAAMVGGALVGQLYTRRKLRNSYTASRSNLSLVWRGSIPFLISNVTASARNLDVVIVSASTGGSAAGHYSAAQKLTSPFMLIPGTIATLVLPAAARRRPSGAAYIAYLLIVIHLILLGALIVVSQFSAQIVQLLLGASFAQSAPILAWTLIAFPFIALSSPLGGVLQSQGFEHRVAINGTIFAVALIPSIAFGAIYFGGVGAAIALAVVYFFKCATLTWIVWRRLRGVHRVG